MNGRPIDQQTCWARLTADVAAAADPEAGVSADVELLINDRSQAGSRTQGIWSGHTVPAISRSSGEIPALDGSGNPTVVLLTRTNLGYAIVTGTGGGGGNCCCCESVDYPDVFLSDGTGTTRIRELCHDLQPIKQRQQHGILTVTFPIRSLMRLVKDAVTDDFLWNIPASAFTAVYHGGTDATSDLIAPSGSVILTPYVAGSGYCLCPKTRLRIEADVEIPEKVV